MPTVRRTPKDIDEYVAAYPSDVRAILRRVRQNISETAPGAQETISYKIPAFTVNGILGYFPAFRKRIGFYPPINGDAKLMKAIARYAGEKGNLRFPLDEPIPHDLIDWRVPLRCFDALLGSFTPSMANISRCRARAAWRGPCAVLGRRTGGTETASRLPYISRMQQDSHEPFLQPRYALGSSSPHLPATAQGDQGDQTDRVHSECGKAAGHIQSSGQGRWVGVRVGHGTTGSCNRQNHGHNDSRADSTVSCECRRNPYGIWQLTRQDRQCDCRVGRRGRLCRHERGMVKVVSHQPTSAARRQASCKDSRT